MDQINYSIIIPHYNTPSLLMRCLKSIPIQPDIQVIVVDDCSPNASMYFESYPELKRPYLELYSTPKGGSAGRARNIGIEHAKGQWLLFVDADDLFTDEAFEELYKELGRTEDILYFNYKRVFSNDLNRKSLKWSNKKDFEDFKVTRNEDPFRYHNHPIWSKVIKKKLVNKYHIRCDESKYGNDVAFSLKCGIHASKIAIIDKPLLLITERPDSLAVALSNGSIPTEKELRVRLDVLINCQDYINKTIPNKKICGYYIPMCDSYLHYYHISFLVHLIKVFSNHPRIGFEMLVFTMRAIRKKIFK